LSYPVWRADKLALGELSATIQEYGLPGVSSSHWSAVPISLPESGVVQLELWLTKLYKQLNIPDKAADYLTGESELVHIGADGRVRLIDSWGHPILYEFSAKDPSVVYKLRSAGPNGVFENGKGDDIKADLTYDVIGWMFSDPNFNGDTYRRYKGRLTVITAPDGTKQIAHP